MNFKHWWSVTALRQCWDVLHIGYQFHHALNHFSAGGKDLLTGSVEQDDADKDDLSLLNEILNAPSTGEDEFTQEWQAVFGAPAMSVTPDTVPAERDPSRRQAEFMPSSLLDTQLSALSLNQRQSHLWFLVHEYYTDLCYDVYLHTWQDCLIGKSLVLDIHAKFFLTTFLFTGHAYMHCWPWTYIPSSVALNLPKGCQVSRKQNVLCSVLCTSFNWLRWNLLRHRRNSKWTPCYHFGVMFS